MHRSGTSALARVLNLLGCDLPKTLMQPSPSNEAGHWESDAIYRLNDRILESAGTTWHDWLELNPKWFDSPKAEEFRDEAIAALNDEFGASRLFVLKDPRICRLLPFWLDVFGRCSVRPLIFLPLRNPLEVAASLEKRNGFEPALGHLLWLRHVLDGEAASRGVPRFFLTYDQLMQAWRRLMEDAQTALDVAWPRLSDRSAAEIDGFLLERYRHHRQPLESVTGNPGLSAWLRETYAIMENWAKAGEKAPDRSTLDSIRKQFNAAAPAFGRLITAGQAARQKAAKLEKSLSEETGKLNAVQASAAAMEQKAGQVEQELAAARARVAEVEKKAADLQSELAKRTGAVQAAEAARAEAVTKAGAAEAAANQQREKAAGLEKELAAARQRAEEAGKRAADLQSELERDRAALQEELAGRAVELETALAERAEAEAQRVAAEAASVEERERAARLEQELAALGQRVRDANEAAQTLEKARSDTEWRRGELEALHAQEQQRAERLEEEAAGLRTRLAEEERTLVALRAELDEQTEAVEDAARAAADLRDRLAVTESALAQRQHETEQTAAELAAAREEIQQAARLRAEREKVVDGLKEHVNLLFSDIKERSAALADGGIALAQAREAAAKAAGERDVLAAELGKARREIEQARAGRVSEVEKAKAELERLKRELAEARAGAETARRQAVGEAERLKAEAERAAKALAEEQKSRAVEGEKARAEHARLEGRLKERFDEIASLTRMVSVAERKADAKDGAIDGMRLALAKEMGKAVSALLDGRAWRVVPGRIRVRRQMALLRRSGLFDAEWYLKHYEDVAKAGVDPLRHYVEHGAHEGREPNRTLAELKSAASGR